MRMIFLTCVFFSGAMALNINSFWATDSECDDIWKGGPDWLDDGFHFDDFEAQVSDCRSMEGLTPGNLGKNVFVHVGKCGGSSVRTALRYSHVDFNVVHVRRVQGCSLDVPRNWVVAVRDPIDRAVSAFNWRSPRNGDQGAPSDNLTEFEVNKFYACFKEVNEFAEALGDNSVCGSRARKILNDHAPHLGMGLEFYLSSELDCILTQKVYLIRVETWAQDISDVTKLFGAAQEPTAPVHANYPMNNNTYLSAKGRARLKETLWQEYEILRKLETNAENGRQLE